MNKRFFELQAFDWVKVMMPNAVWHHCLAIVDVEFAHSVCGKIFNLSELVGVDDRDTGKRCPACSVHAPN